MSLNPAFDAEVARNIRSKNASLDAPKPGRIEDLAAQIAELDRRENELNDLFARLETKEGDMDQILINSPARQVMIRLKNEADDIGNRKSVLEDIISWEVPGTAREAFLMMLLVGWRNANDGKEESDAVARLIDRITLFLEGLSGTTAEALGLGNFILRPDIELEAKAKRLLEAAVQPHAEAAS